MQKPSPLEAPLGPPRMQADGCISAYESHYETSTTRPPRLGGARSAVVPAPHRVLRIPCADLLEIGTIIRSDGTELAIHAMRLRPRYRQLLPGE
jgi:hypothetical protein